METLEDFVLAFLPGDVVDSRDALLSSGEWSRLLLSEEVFFLAQAVQAPSRTIVGGRGRRGTEEERLLLHPLREYLLGSVRGMCSREQFVSYMIVRGHVGVGFSFLYHRYLKRFFQ